MGFWALMRAVLLAVKAVHSPLMSTSDAKKEEVRALKKEQRKAEARARDAKRRKSQAEAKIRKAEKCPSGRHQGSQGGTSHECQEASLPGGQKEIKKNNWHYPAAEKRISDSVGWM